ncbi:hypothetical protein NS277_11365 [Novosphingobium barchaimii]|nr:hypothetical protein NS277_11365 [Novosphingobium barchaimii]
MDSRPQHKVPRAEQRVGDNQIFLGESSAAPQHDIKVEHARTPGHTARAAAEACLQSLQAAQQARWPQTGVDNGDRIGIAAPRRAMGGRRDDA